MRHENSDADVQQFLVSIHIRSEDRMRHAAGHTVSEGEGVSIHIRSEDRMRLIRAAVFGDKWLFQSTSGPKTG